MILELKVTPEPRVIPELSEILELKVTPELRVIPEL